MNLPGNGMVNATVTVSENLTGLNPGTYTDNITITAEGASNSPLIVPVTLTVTAGGGSTFVYDGDGRRVKKTENGQTTIYVNKYFESNLTASENTTYYYLGSRLTAMRRGESLRYIHQDHLTGTSLMTDTSGAQVGTTMKYYPFGGTRSGSVPTDIRFTGQRLDESGLYYFNARYYDPQIGRFISADTVMQILNGLPLISKPLTVQNVPLKFGSDLSPQGTYPLSTSIATFTPQNLSRYSYVHNNPLKFIDSNGNTGALAILHTVVSLVIGSAAFGILAYEINCLITGQTPTYGGISNAAIEGVATTTAIVTGAILTAEVSPPAGLVAASTISVSGHNIGLQVQSYIDNTPIDSKHELIDLISVKGIEHLVNKGIELIVPNHTTHAAIEIIVDTVINTTLDNFMDRIDSIINNPSPRNSEDVSPLGDFPF